MRMYHLSLNRNYIMSKIGNWIFEMQEDAAWMSKPVFVSKHGVSHENVWETIQQDEFFPDTDPTAIEVQEYY